MGIGHGGVEAEKCAAQLLGHNYIGTEHILLGLIREGDGVVAQLLVRLGADLSRVRQQVIQLLHGYQGKEAISAGTGRGSRLPDDVLARPQRPSPVFHRT